VRSDQIVDFYAGSAEDIVIALTDDVGAPVGDLSGWTGKAQAKHRAIPTDPPLVEWSTAAGSLVLANSAARLKVSASMAAASLGWEWRLAWLDLALVTPSGQGSLPQRPFRTAIRLIPGVTAAT
jgi:hypothetical protein